MPTAGEAPAEVRPRHLSPASHRARQAAKRQSPHTLACRVGVQIAPQPGGDDAGTRHAPSGSGDDGVGDRSRAAARDAARSVASFYMQREHAASDTRSDSMRWLESAVACLDRGEQPQSCLLMDVFAGRPREWSLTGAVRKVAPERVAIGFDKRSHSAEDITSPHVFGMLERVIDAGIVDHLWVAIPCESYTAMWLSTLVEPFRRRSEPDGCADMPREWQWYVRKHNDLTRRGCHLAAKQWRAGRTYYIENPTDQGLPQSPFFRWRLRHHAPLWLTSWVRALVAETRPRWATMTLCGWFGRFHKPTTIAAAGPGASITYEYNAVRCTTPKHTLGVMDVNSEGRPYSTEAGEYPPAMCGFTIAYIVGKCASVRGLLRNEATVAQFLTDISESTGSATSKAGAARRAKRVSWATGARLQHVVEYEPQPALEVQRAPGSAPDRPLIDASWRSAHTELPSGWIEKEALDGSGLAEARAAPLQFVSRRRAEPELSETLAARPLPTPSVRVASAQRTFYSRVEWPTGCPPRPIAAFQLYEDGVYDDILAAIADVQHACRKGARGGVVPKTTAQVFPLSLMKPFARALVEAGGSWDSENPLDVRPLQPFDDAETVPQAVNASFFKRWARTLQWTDHDMLHMVSVSGVEGRSECSKATIVMGHHRGLREHFAPAAAAIDADTAAGYVRRCGKHPPVLPAIMVARNCVPRHQWKLKAGVLSKVVKWRVTTDDSISVDGEVSRNGGEDPETWERTGLPAARTLAEMVAIVKATAAAMGFAASRVVFEQIALWALDLCEAYRMLVVQRAEWGQQCYVWADGVRLDLRCLFGSAHMVELFQRVTTFVLAAAQHRVQEYDAQHPYSAAREAWCQWRSEQLGSRQVCSASVIYLDDGLGLTCHGEDEPLVGRHDGAIAPVRASLHVEHGDTGAVHVRLQCFPVMSRAQTHLAIMRATFQEAGWGVAVEKVQLGWSITELGLQCASGGDGALTVPEAKRLGMIEDIKAMQPPPVGSVPADGLVDATHVDTVTGRCGHIAQVAPEANAYMSPMYRLAKGRVTVRVGRMKTRLRVRPSRIRVTGSGPAAAEFQDAIAWWRHALESGVSTPLAPRLEFPALGNAGVAFAFTDAAREAGTGHGGFTMIRAEGGLTMVDMDPRWPPDILSALQQNELSMPAGEGIGAVALADALAACLEGLTHLVMFTDSVPVKAALLSGNSGSLQLNFIVRWLFQRRPGLQILALHQPGKLNDVADGLSRSESRQMREQAAAHGARVITLPADPAVWAMSRTARSMPQST